MRCSRRSHRGYRTRTASRSPAESLSTKRTRSPISSREFESFRRPTFWSSRAIRWRRSVAAPVDGGTDRRADRGSVRRDRAADACIARQRQPEARPAHATGPQNASPATTAARTRANEPSMSCSTVTARSGSPAFPRGTTSAACSACCGRPEPTSPFRRTGVLTACRSGVGMIRFCPNCRTERPLTEFYCEGTRDGVTCHWDLSGVEISEPGAVPRPTPTPPSPSAGSVCPNGHAVGQGDLICPVCEVPLVTQMPSAFPTSPPEHTPDTEPTVIDGWRLSVRLPASSPVRERFVAVRESDGRQAVLTLYAEGSEPDPAVYDAIRKLPRDHVPEIIATGRWRDRAFEVAEELTGGDLSALVVSPQRRRHGAADRRTAGTRAERIFRMRPAAPRSASRQSCWFAPAIRSISRSRTSVRRDCPNSISTSSRRWKRRAYMAPEAIAGGVAAASDWWSLGMLLLERLTSGAMLRRSKRASFSDPRRDERRSDSAGPRPLARSPA